MPIWTHDPIDPGGMDLPWPAEPLVPGDWKYLPPPLMASLAAQCAAGEAAGAPPLPAPIRRMRALALRFLPGWVLVEGLFDQSPSAMGVFRLMLHDEGFVVVDGSLPLLAVTKGQRPDFGDDPGRVSDYLRLFTALTRSAEGRFAIVESMAQLTSGRVIEPSKALRLARLMSGLQDSPVDGEPGRTALVCYGQGVFRARFSIGGDGIVRMLDEKLLIPDALTCGETWEGPWQIFAGSATSPVNTSLQADTTP